MISLSGNCLSGWRALVVVGLLIAMSWHQAECQAQIEGGAKKGANSLDALEEQAIKQAAALVGPSVVRIETVGGLDRVGNLLTGTGPTTGVVVSKDGYIISSAFNFVNQPASILVVLPDGRRVAAEKVATDKLRMLTLLKVDGKDLTPAVAAPAESFRVGQWAIALGRTLDETTPNVSLGIVSALKRIWGKAIQTDAKVSPLNYGGPLVDIQGRVLGILVPLSPQGTSEVAGVEWYDAGIGFAIPMVDVLAELDRLKQGKDLHPGLMGVTMRGRDLYEGQPVLDRVRFGSPAQQAGLKEEDVVVEIDGQKIVRQAQLLHVLGTRLAGDTIKVTVKRGNETLTRDITLVDQLVPYESAYLGILPVREPASRGETKGVTVRYVFKDGPAAKAGLQRGDRIVRCNEKETNQPAALLDLISRLRPNDEARLVVIKAGMDKEGEPIKVTLSAIPDAVPADLPSPVMQGRDNKDLKDAKEGDGQGLKVGRFSERMMAHEHEFWAFVPEDYNPDHKYGLMVWIHPSGDTMEASIMSAWKTLCEERGVILLAPKAKQVAGWNANESEFVKDAVEQMIEKYSIDRQRVFLHAFSNGGDFTYHLAFKYRQQFRGVATVGAPLRMNPPDNEPDFRLQFHFTSGDKDPLHRAVIGTAQGLKRLKFPVTHAIVSGGDHKYPQAASLQEIARWMDLLDRI